MRCCKFALLALPLLAIAACGKDACNSTDAACIAAANGATKTFAVMMTSSPANLGAIIFDVAGGGTMTLTLTTDATVRSQVGATADPTRWRGVLLGKPTAVRIGTIVLDSASTALPTATVIEAAANASGNFMPIATANVTLVVQKLN